MGSSASSWIPFNIGCIGAAETTSRIPQRGGATDRIAHGDFQNPVPTKPVVSNIVKVNFPKPQQLYSDFYNNLRNIYSIKTNTTKPQESTGHFKQCFFHLLPSHLPRRLESVQPHRRKSYEEGEPKSCWRENGSAELPRNPTAS